MRPIGTAGELERRRHRALALVKEGFSPLLSKNGVIPTGTPPKVL